jgi:hypothetical protein
MMVSLDHSIYFHEPRRFRADEWMFTEMSSPWSGDGRGVVQQHMFTADGTLVATCFQEVSTVASLAISMLTKLGRCKIERGASTRCFKAMIDELKIDVDRASIESL